MFKRFLAVVSHPFARAAAAGLVAAAGVVALPASAVTPQPSASPAAALAADTDPYLWLEDVLGERALSWVRARNAVTVKALESRPDFAPTRDRLLAVLNAKDRIPKVKRQGDYFYNLWQDDAHKRGLWRRTTLAEYRKAQPAWETVLDIDALSASEKESWVWEGADCFGPSDRRCIVALSRGGADAKVQREFDTVDKRFVAGGFQLPEAKSTTTWVDADTLYVGTDFGPGSLTDSGYPRVLKRWRRGTPLAEATTVFEGEAKDVSVDVDVVRTPGHEHTMFTRSIDFFHWKRLLLRGAEKVPLEVPDDAQVEFVRDALVIELRSDWKLGETSHPAGSLLVADAARYLAGERKLQPLFTPTATRSMAGWVATRDQVIVNMLDNVAGRLEEWSKGDGGGYVRRDVLAPFPGALSITALQDPLLDKDPLAGDYLLSYTDFLTPESLYLAHGGSDQRELLKSNPTQFASEGMRVQQLFATSKDGTRVPYFVVWPKGAQADGRNPTLLYGYGGFQVSEEPWYSGTFGSSWMEKGGVLVVANIRGGGEYGPQWHEAAIKANKQRSYDDFIAVAEDLIERKITSPRHLGIEGGSNGGLLVGAVMVQRPELFNAVVCQVPLLDMRRYHKLLAGASWMAEYGNPDDPAEWEFIRRYSPYQNVKAGVKYPKVLFVTSTRDDRVHPGHARKMAAKMMAEGHPLLYYENIEGGHGAAADNLQRAQRQAMEFTFLRMQLHR